MDNAVQVVGIGGANIDLHIKAYDKIILRDSNPGKVHFSAGGVTRNILENLTKLGISSSFISFIGKDAFGKEILESCQNTGIQTDRVYISDQYPSGSYIDFLDNTGDMYLASCDASGIENLPLSYLKDQKDLISCAKAIVCDTNLVTQQLEIILENAGSVPVFIDPVSTAKALRVKDLIGKFYLIKPNRMELEVLSDRKCDTKDDIRKAVAVLLDKGTACVAVSLGKDGCYYASRNGKAFFAGCKEVEMQNASGAGDAFMAGLLYSYCHNYPEDKSIQTALACGSLAVGSKTTINPLLSEQLVQEYITKKMENL